MGDLWKADNQVPNSNFYVKKINDSLMYIESYQDYFHSEIPLADQYGEDSLNWDGDFVYPEASKPVFNSGVYNLKTSKWILPAKYRKIIIKNDSFYGEFEGPNRHFLYDRFSFSGKLQEESVKLED